MSCLEFYAVFYACNETDPTSERLSFRGVMNVTNGGKNEGSTQVGCWVFNYKRYRQCNVVSRLVRVTARYVFAVDALRV